MLAVVACDDKVAPLKRQLTLEAFSDLRADEYALNPQLIRENLEHISRADNDSNLSSQRIRKYYRHRGSIVWLDASGFDSRADTLLATLKARLPEMGFNGEVFRIKQIGADLDRIRTLSFDQRNDINSVAARLEYNLTKAYLRYVTGQHFGFVNPSYVLNHFAAQSRDTAGRVRSYHHLYDVDMYHPDDDYTHRALSRATPDSLGLYLAEVARHGQLYDRLREKLAAATDSQKRRILVNMERCRWKNKLTPQDGEKYVVVNVPAYHLWAVSPDTVIDMRVACGAVRTKTPLLTSRITHMDVNPEWSIPLSIVSADIARHAGSEGYFASRRYYIVSRKSGKRVSASQVSSSGLRSGAYRVVQQGGAGNALGRIIFRFPNNFSVFLHDTSSPGAFGRDNRGVSHGCVRVQRPFDLARFMMDRDADEWLVDRLRLSMGLEPEGEQGRAYRDSLRPGAKVPTLVRRIDVNPRVPIIITYYTMFQTPDGQMMYYPDVYGYDKAIGEALKPYML